MAKDIEHYHRQLLAILDDNSASVPIRAAGHQAIRALIEEIHDQGYVLGQLHADGIFPEGQEANVAAREERLGIEALKTAAGREQDRRRAAGTVHGIRPHLPRTPEQHRAERELAEKYVRDDPINMAGLELPGMWEQADLQGGQADTEDGTR